MAAPLEAHTQKASIFLTTHTSNGLASTAVLESMQKRNPRIARPMNAQVQAFHVRAMPLIVLVVSALLLLWASIGASLLLDPSIVEPAERWVGLPMLVVFGGMFLASLVTLFNYRIRVNHDGITLLLPFGGSVTYGRDEMDVSIKRRIIRLRTVGGMKLGWRRLFIPQRSINTYLVIKQKKSPDTGRTGSLATPT